MCSSKSPTVAIIWKPGLNGMLENDNAGSISSFEQPLQDKRIWSHRTRFIQNFVMIKTKKEIKCRNFLENFALVYKMRASINSAFISNKYESLHAPFQMICEQEQSQ